jgi:hypothetical protein
MPRRPVICMTPLTAGDLRDDSYLKTLSDEFGNKPRDYMFPLEEDEDDDTRNDNALPGATLERIQDLLKPAKDTKALQVGAMQFTAYYGRLVPSLCCLMQHVCSSLLADLDGL